MSSRVFVSFFTKSAKNCIVSASLSGPRRSIQSLHCWTSHGARWCFAFDPGEDFAVAFGLLQLGQQLFCINAREVEEPLVQRAVVVILAVLVGERRAALVQQPWQLRVAAEADARTARRMLGEVGRVIRWCFVSGCFHVQLMVDG